MAGEPPAPDADPPRSQELESEPDLEPEPLAESSRSRLRGAGAASREPEPEPPSRADTPPSGVRGPWTRTRGASRGARTRRVADDGDLLEDTPDFLQETPEHDRLWFEQKPPRDFDFD